MDPVPITIEGNATALPFCAKKKKKKKVFPHTHFCSFLPFSLEAISKFKEDFGTQGEP